MPNVTAQAPFVEADHPRASDGTFKDKHKPQRDRPDVEMPSAPDPGGARYGHAVLRGGSADPRARIRSSAPLAPHPRILAWQPRLRRLVGENPRLEDRLIEAVTRLVDGMVEADSGGEPPRWNPEWEEEALDLLREESGGAAQDGWEKVYEPRSPYGDVIWDRAYDEALSRASRALHSISTARHAEDALLDAAQNAYSAYVGVPLRELGSLDNPDTLDKMSAFTHRTRCVLASWLEYIDRNSDNEEAAEEKLLKHIDASVGFYAGFAHNFDPDRRAAGGEDDSQQQQPSPKALEEHEGYEALRSRFYDNSRTEPDTFTWDLFESLPLDAERLDAEAQVDRLTRFVARGPRHSYPIGCNDPRIMRIAKLLDAPSDTPQAVSQLNSSSEIDAALAVHSGGHPDLRDSFVVWYDSQTEAGQQVGRILRGEDQ